MKRKTHQRFIGSGKKLHEDVEGTDYPIYLFKAVNVFGHNISLDQYCGKVLLVVNLGRKSRYVN